MYPGIGQVKSDIMFGDDKFFLFRLQVWLEGQIFLVHCFSCSLFSFMKDVVLSVSVIPSLRSHFCHFKRIGSCQL